MWCLKKSTCAAITVSVGSVMEEVFYLLMWRMTWRRALSVHSSSVLFAEREGVVQLGLLPFYHIYAVMATFVTSLSRGQTSVIVPGFDPRVFLEVVPKFKVGLHNFDCIEVIV